MLQKRQYIEPNILEIAIMEMCRLRKEDSFFLVDVVKWIYPQHWHYFLKDAERAMMELYRSGKIIVLENDYAIVSDLESISLYRIKAIVKTS
ncbi:hypothetical protein [Aquiflexum sp.]|uniref:hypothetical protein n=1 Tax=Aquiflexum sp. TaxID=1872584 RepID=UPI00359394E7